MKILFLTLTEVKPYSILASLFAASSYLKYVCLHVFHGFPYYINGITWHLDTWLPPNMWRHILQGHYTQTVDMAVALHIRYISIKIPQLFAVKNTYSCNFPMFILICGYPPQTHAISIYIHFKVDFLKPFPLKIVIKYKKERGKEREIYRERESERERERERQRQRERE